MAMTRAQLLEYAIAEFGDLADQARLSTNTDTPGGWGPILDRVFRALGTAESALSSGTLTDAQTPAGLALLEYFTLRRVVRSMASQQNTSGRTVTVGRSQIYTQYRDQMEDASKQVVAMGYGKAAGILRSATMHTFPSS